METPKSSRDRSSSGRKRKLTNEFKEVLQTDSSQEEMGKSLLEVVATNRSSRAAKKKALDAIHKKPRIATPIPLKESVPLSQQLPKKRRSNKKEQATESDEQTPVKSVKSEHDIVLETPPPLESYAIITPSPPAIESPKPRVTINLANYRAAPMNKLFKFKVNNQ